MPRTSSPVPPAQCKTQTLLHDRSEFPLKRLFPVVQGRLARLQVAGHVHRVQPERPAQLQFEVRTRLAPLQAALHLTVSPLQAEAACSPQSWRFATLWRCSSPAGPLPRPASPGISNSGHPVSRSAANRPSPASLIRRSAGRPEPGIRHPGAGLFASRYILRASSCRPCTQRTSTRCARNFSFSQQR